MRKPAPHSGSRIPDPARVHYAHPSAEHQCADQLDQVLGLYPGYRELACICIGTDRSTGDALGPLVGTRLESLALPALRVYGTLDEPVHAVNLNQALSRMEKELKNPRIIAIDACLGQLANVGSIQVKNGPLRPGAGVNKQLPSVGQIHMTGIVNVSGFMEYFVLQNTRLNMVMKMAHVIASAIEAVAVSRIKRQPQ